VLFLVYCLVDAIISLGDYLMEFRVDETSDQRAKTTTTTSMSLQTIDSGQRQWSVVLPLVPPTEHVTAPAIAYKMLGIRRLRTLLPIAAFCRCCCCCCAGRLGRVMSANSRRPASLSWLDRPSVGLSIC